VLSQVVTDCSQLRTLDVTNVETGVTEQFLACLCEFALELCHLGLTLGPRIGRDVLEGLIQTAPSLKTLSLTVVNQNEQTKSASDNNSDHKELDENYLIKVIRQYHGNPCYCNVYKQTPSSKIKQFVLTFTPLKFLTAGSLTSEI
jgi:hypothetical protein